MLKTQKTFMQYNVKLALKTFDFYMNLDYAILRSFMEDE